MCAMSSNGYTSQASGSVVLYRERSVSGHAFSAVGAFPAGEEAEDDVKWEGELWVGGLGTRGGGRRGGV